MFSYGDSWGSSELEGGTEKRMALLEGLVAALLSEGSTGAGQLPHRDHVRHWG